MPTLVPVDHDPFADGAAAQPPPVPTDEGQPVARPQQSGPQLVPVDNNPFAGHPTAGPSGSFLADAARRVATGAADAMTGLISPILRSGGVGLNVSPNGDKTVTYQPPPADPAQVVQSARDNFFNKLGATEYIPQTEGGKLGQAAIAGTIGALVNPSTIPAAVGGAVGSQGGQDLVSWLWPSAPAWAKDAAGFLGMLGGAKGGQATGNFTANTASKALPGPRIDPSDAALADAAINKYHIPLYGGLISDSDFVKYLNSQLAKVPGSGYGPRTAAIQEAVNRAVAGTIGEDAPRITDKVMSAARTRIGNALDTIESNNNVSIGQPSLNRLAQIEADAKASLTDPEYQTVSRLIDNVVNQAASGNGVIPGKTFGNLIHKGSPLDAATNNSNSNISGYAGQIKSALRDALQGSLSGDDLNAYQTARNQWKNMKTIEPLVVKSPNGDISAQSLMGVVRPSYSGAAYNASPDLVQLAKIGQGPLKKMPDSGTATRNMVGHGLGALGAVGGTMAAGEHFGLPLTYTAGALGGAVAGARALGGALRSDFYTNMLLNRALGRNISPFGVPGLPAVGAATSPLLLGATTPGIAGPQPGVFWVPPANTANSAKQ